MIPFRNPPDPLLVRMLAACHNGSERARTQAWDDLARCLVPLARNIAIREQRRILFSHRHKPEIAEDAAMHALVMLHVHLVNMTNPAKLFPWLAKVIQNKLIDLARSHYMQRVTLGDEMMSLRESARGIANDEHLDLRIAIRRLSRIHREVIFDAYWLQLSVAEISARRGVSEGTVKSRLYTARRYILDIICETEEAPV